MFAGGLFAGLPISVATGVVYEGTNVIELVEDRANEITIPAVTDQAVRTRTMAWDDATNRFVASAQPTRISEFCKQVNKRVLGSSVLSSAVIVRCEAVDADTGGRLVFTPGATPVGSLQDFQIIIPDQLGGYESRGFLMFLATNANPNAGIDGGQVLLRLMPSAFPWA